MRRREFITLLAGSAASMPLAARAQQPPVMPVVGFLDGGSPRERTQQVAAFRKGVRDEHLNRLYELSDLIRYATAAGVWPMLDRALRKGRRY
jgi:hypothetical protein